MFTQCLLHNLERYKKLCIPSSLVANISVAYKLTNQSGSGIKNGARASGGGAGETQVAMQRKYTTTVWK